MYAIHWMFKQNSTKFNMIQGQQDSPFSTKKYCLIAFIAPMNVHVMNAAQYFLVLLLGEDIATFCAVPNIFCINNICINQAVLMFQGLFPMENKKADGFIGLSPVNAYKPQNDYGKISLSD